MKLLEWLSLEQVVADELIQAEQEGKNIKPLIAEKKVIDSIRDREERQVRLQEFYKLVANLPVTSDFPYREPVDLEGIESEADYLSAKMIESSPEADYDRIYGAWLGRCAGCLLGKPIEGMSHDRIELLLQWKDAFPLKQYISDEGGIPPNFDMDSEQVKRYTTGVFENLAVNKGMLRDDDIDYTILGLTVLEEAGPSFTPMDIGAAWMTRIPLLMTYTAERVAYMNLANDLNPPMTSRNLNPYREWIGAQIRADIWGYVSPGDPMRAARFAFKDAIVSHKKNGVYGEMFVAAAIAAAATTCNVNEIIDIAVSYTPRRSRFAKMVEQVKNWYIADKDWQVTLKRIYQAYGNYSWFHTLPNAAIVVMALLYSEADFETAISIAVMSGLDTDCNGATVGSILGMLLGAHQLPAKWIEPLRDRVSTAIVGETDSQISDLARRTTAVLERIRH